MTGAIRNAGSSAARSDAYFYVAGGEADLEKLAIKLGNLGLE
ncbi:hypothetical protein ACTMU2_14330 [Cupriavidus basilensis]